MRKIIMIGCAVVVLIAAGRVSCFASDWDKAGKILTVLEGVRVITGGRVDPIGTLTGINKGSDYPRERVYVRQGNYHEPRYRHQVREYTRVWVPHYVWEVRYIPRHVEYRRGHGRVIIEGHYEKFKIERGGHWETRYDCD